MLITVLERLQLLEAFNIKRPTREGKPVPFIKPVEKLFAKETATWISWGCISLFHTLVTHPHLCTKPPAANNTIIYLTFFRIDIVLS